MLEYGTEVRVTGKRHDTKCFPTAVVFDPRPVMGGGVRYRAVFIPVFGRPVEANLYSDEVGNVVRQHTIDSTVALIWRCRGW